jgi:hypothetical protein
MRQKTAKVCLSIAAIWFILGGFVLGNASAWLVIAAIFACLTAFLGVRWVRISGVVLVVASIVVAIGEYRAEQVLKARVREIRQKASEKEGSRVELYPLPNKPSVRAEIDPGRGNRGDCL